MPELRVRKDLTLPPKLLKWFEDYADDHERTLTFMIEQAMREFKENHFDPEE